MDFKDMDSEDMKEAFRNYKKQALREIPKRRQVKVVSDSSKGGRAGGSNGKFYGMMHNLIKIEPSKTPEKSTLSIEPPKFYLVAQNNKTFYGQTEEVRETAGRS